MIEGWKATTIGDAPFQIIDGDRGKNYPKKTEFTSTGHCLFLNTKNVTSSGFVFEELNFVTEERDQLLRKGKLERNDLVLTTRGTVGNVAFFSDRIPYDNVRINSGMVIIRPSTIDPAFNYQLFKSLKPEFDTHATGSAQPQLPIRDLSLIEFFLPPPNEQKAIAGVLSSLDEKIELLDRQNATLEALGETLFRQYFIEESQNDWAEQPLDEVANFLNGLACQKYPAKNPVDRLPVLKIKDLKSDLSGSSDWATSKVPAQYIVQNGDIIFSWSASLLVKLWDGPTCVLNQHLFKVTSDRFPQWFIYLWTKHHLERFIAIAETKATTMGHIKRGDLAEAMVHVPDDTKLFEMGEIFAPILEKIISNNKQIKTLEKHRDTLLPMLMSGEVRVKVEAIHA